MSSTVGIHGLKAGEDVKPSFSDPPRTRDVLALLTPLFVVTGQSRFIQEQLLDEGLSILNGSRRRLDTRDATFLTRSHLGQPYFADLITHLTSGPVILMHLQGHDPLTALHHVIRRLGSMHETSPLGLQHTRAQQALYYSQSPQDVQQDLLYVGFVPTQDQEPMTPHARRDVTPHTSYSRSR